jgi:hypothetical protein
MDAKLLEGVAGKLSERVVAAVVSPAFTFLAVGLVAWLSNRGWAQGWAELTAWAGQRKTGEALLLIVAGLLVVLVLGSLVNAVSVPVIRLLEGYWPRQVSRLAGPLLRRQERALRDLNSVFQQRAEAALSADAGERSRWETTRAEDDLERYPIEASLLLPTRLGNTLRASELRPFYKYGFDPVRCWYQLWLVLPESTRTEIVTARARLDAAAVAFTFSVAVAVWTIFAWWAPPLAVLAAVVSYRVYAIPAAQAYGDVVEAACDVHRASLFTALRLTLPESPIADQKLATFVNGYLQRGASTSDRIFLRPG